MKTLMFAAAPLAAIFVLGGCSNDPIQVGAADPQANLVKNLSSQTPTPTPSIKSSRAYRCKDNSLVHITFMSDDITAMVRDSEEEPPRVTLKAPAPGQSFVAEGYSLSGSGTNVTYKSPDSPSQTCHT